MRYLLKFLWVLINFLNINQAEAQLELQTIQKLKNDKEVLIQSLSKREVKAIREQFPDAEVNKKIGQLFYQSVQQFLSQEDQKCELKFLDVISQNLQAAGHAKTPEERQDIFRMLRVTHGIDDILYDILTGIHKDYIELGVIKQSKKPHRISGKKKQLLKHNSLEDLFSNFTTWPDESSLCSYQEYIFIKKNLRNKDDEPSKKKSILKDLIFQAYKQNIISLESFNKLEYLRKESFINRRNYWLNDYFKIIFNAKNKMNPILSSYKVKNLEEESDFSSERIRRFKRLTRRKLLYQKYDETQIILLAQVLQKASKRMGVDPDTKSGRPYITQEFNTLTESGERKTYVEKIELDPQSQYNLARRLLRKDMTELQMMDTFIGLKITFEDVVMAAFETGYISFEDIEYVVKYDDLWNSNLTRFERIVGFTATVARIGSIFVPPPWNIPTSIAIGVAETIILGTRKNGAENDNPATFIE